MSRVFIGVGSNLGDRKTYFELARKKLAENKDIRDLQCSPVYETDPIGGEGQARYWNAVWSLETELDPRSLLKRLHHIEAQAGRKRKAKDEPRTLDLDILFFGDQKVLEKDLILPHPRLHERAFVLVPFCDLAPDWEHPLRGRTTRQLLEDLLPEERIKCVKIKNSKIQDPCLRQANNFQNGNSQNDK